MKPSSPSTLPGQPAGLLALDQAAGQDLSPNRRRTVDTSALPAAAHGLGLGAPAATRPRTVRRRRWLFDVPLVARVPLDGAGVPIYRFGRSGEVPGAAAATRRALDDALESSILDPVAGLAALERASVAHRLSLLSPLEVPYWQVFLPGEAIEWLGASCELPELAQVPGARVYGMTNGWVMHVYPDLPAGAARPERQGRLRRKSMAAELRLV